MGVRQKTPHPIRQKGRSLGVYPDACPIHTRCVPDAYPMHTPMQ